MKTGEAVLQGKARARRADPHVRQWVVQHAVQAGVQQTAGQVHKSLHESCKADVRGWQDKELAAMRASMHMDFRESVCFSL
eukprot:16452043-Heterocapsa_arctica.AAC.1